MHSSHFVPHPYGILPRGNAPDDETALMPNRFGGSFVRLFGSLPLAQQACEELIVKAKTQEGCFSVANSGIVDQAVKTRTKEATAKKKKAPSMAKDSSASHISGGGNLSQFADEGITMSFILDLTAFMTVKDICILAATCSGWYTFLHANGDVWRRQHLMITDRLRYVQDWKTTVVRLYLESMPNKKASALASTFTHTPLRVSKRLYCDTLFQSWICTNLPSDFGLIKRSAKVSEVDSNKAAPHKWNYRSKFKQVDVIDVSALTEEQFNDGYEKKNIPLVVKGGCKDWPLYKLLQGYEGTTGTDVPASSGTACDNLASLTSGSIIAKLFAKDGGSINPLQCESFKMTPKEYVSYAVQQQDERPTYLFDPDFGETSMDVSTMYTVPQIFARDDYFRFLKDRPKYRWIIAGPSRGGSNFHVDPNFTNAWNACITGKKRWLFFPPHSPPCGVYPSADMADVTTPETLSEWLLNFYQPTVETMRDVGYECICDAGDIAFVPCGWWHLVINLEDSIAVTQNYVSRNNLGKVLLFLKFMQKSISGIGEDDCEEFNAASNSGGEVAAPKPIGGGGGMSMASVCSRQSNLHADLIKALEPHAPDALKDAYMAEAAVEARMKLKALQRAGMARSLGTLVGDSDDEVDGQQKPGDKRPRDVEVAADGPQRQSIQFDNGLSGGFQF